MQSQHQKVLISATEDQDDSMQPSFNEIDEVMKHMNDGGSDFGVERAERSWDQSSVDSKAVEDMYRANLGPPQPFRSDAPSPSPRRLHPLMAHEVAGSASSTQNPFSDERAIIASPRGRMDGAGETPASEWDDAVSTTEDSKFRGRSRFFDSHVDALINSVLEARLSPLEKMLQAMQVSLSNIAPKSSSRMGRRAVSEILDSDADDEDDEDVKVRSQHRTRSPVKDRKMDKIRQTIQEAIAAHQPQPQVQASPLAPAASIDSTELYQAVADMKASASLFAVKSLQLADVKEIVEEAVTHHNIAEGHSYEEALAEVKASAALFAQKGLQLEQVKDIVEDALNRQSATLAQLQEKSIRTEPKAPSIEGMDIPDATSARLEAEVKARLEAEDREASAAKMLRLAEEELDLYKESAQDESSRMQGFVEESRTLKDRLALSAEVQLQLQAKIESLSEDASALELTLEEYRASAAKWRREIEGANEEKDHLKKTLDALNHQVDEAIRIREAMRDRLNILQADMSTASGQMASEKARWQRADEEHRKRYEVLNARVEAEVRIRERFEKELERLELQERDSASLRIVLDETRNANSRLEETVSSLRLENHEHQETADRYAREFREAREAGRVEVQRTRILLEAEIEVANNQVNIVRADLEAEVNRARNDLENANMDADTAKEKHELMLEQEADTRREALRKAEDAQSLALEEQRQRHEQRIQDLQEQHMRALGHSHEDKQRSEMVLNERLSLASEKNDILNGTVQHLEEKLDVAKSAAQAAVLAAQTAKAPATVIAATSPQRLPERISPQALRESIAVLQEQLQEREGRIESLEQEIERVDKDAPAKLKEREVELGWLRELLGVRVDDIADLVNALSEPTFSRDAVRNAAIRIRTNLQMEQAEKERLMSGAAPFPTLASISNFASPKAAQLAAAFGNWRKSSNFPSSLSNTVSHSANGSRNGTPSRSAASTSLPNGLMTPPASNMRRTPTPDARSGADSKMGALTRPPRPLAGRGRSPVISRKEGKQPVPSTPPLMREASYDQDAEVSTDGYYDDDESTVDGEGHSGDLPSLDRVFEPFEPAMGEE